MTLATTVAALSGLSVTGVTTARTAPPQTVNAGELPLSFPRIPDIRDGVLAFNGDNGLPVYTVELVVLVAPIASNVYATSFATCLTIIDNIMTALEASVIANGWNEWVIRQEYATVGDVQYWSIVAKVEAS